MKAVWDTKETECVSIKAMSIKRYLLSIQENERNMLLRGVKEERREMSGS